MNSQPGRDEESSIMRQVQDGDTAELAVLYERHHLALYRYLLGLSGNRALSEDLVQEVFLRVIKYASSYNPRLSVQGWLFSIARNAWIDAARKTRKETYGTDWQQMENSQPAAEQVVTRQQESALLHKALGNLSPDKREVLILSRFEDLKYDEIGRILQCEAGTVRVRVYRALKELRDRFGELSGGAAGEKAYGA